jgi:hypothetical protein
VAVARVSSALLVAVSTSRIPCFWKFWKGNITLLAMPEKGKPPTGKLLHCPKKRL